MRPWKRRKAELIPVPTHGPVKLEPVQPKHVSLVAYAARVIYVDEPESWPPFVERYHSLAEELRDRRRWRSMGMAVVYRVTVKPKAA